MFLYSSSPLTSPGAFQHCFVKNLLFPCPSSRSSGGGACCADSQVCAPEGTAPPPARGRPQWELFILCGPCSLAALLSSRHKVTPGGTTTVAAASSPALESAPTVTTQFPVCRGLMLPGRGALTCTARGRPAAGVSSLSWALQASACPGRSTGSWAVSPAPWDRGPALLESRSRAEAPKAAGHIPLRPELPPDQWAAPRGPAGCAPALYSAWPRGTC